MLRPLGKSMNMCPELVTAQYPSQKNDSVRSPSLKAAPQQRQGRYLLSFPRPDSFGIKAGPEPRQPSPAEGRECPQRPDSGRLWRLGKRICSYLNLTQVRGETAMFCTLERNVSHCLPAGDGQCRWLASSVMPSASGGPRLLLHCHFSQAEKCYSVWKSVFCSTCGKDN